MEKGAGIQSILLRVSAGILLFVAGGAAGWYANSLRSMPADVPTIAFFDDWRLACPALGRAGRCGLSQDLVDGKTHVQIAHLTLSRENGATTLAVTVPYDVLLPSGIGLKLDDGKVRVQRFETCDSRGCTALIPVDKNLEKALLQAKQGRLLFANLANKVMALPFSLRGFDRADAALTASLARRRLWGSDP